jgi:hypothetical protein
MTEHMVTLVSGLKVKASLKADLDAIKDQYRTPFEEKRDKHLGYPELIRRILKKEIGRRRL